VVGDVSILVNNAGIILNGKSILDLNDIAVERTFRVNALAHFWVQLYKFDYKK
jgi:NAD(P)-dependent dehydrogenase (short-subunit alcohol dehydrogenase family)